MTEAAPTTDLGEIFSRDPLLLTRSDITTVIAYFRDARKRYIIAASAPKPAKTKATKPKPTGEEIDLTKLDL